MTAPAGRSTATRRSAQLLFWSWFNTRTFKSSRETATWTEERFRFWLAFTLRSILGQREGDWRYWLVCSRALRHLTEPLRAAITDPRVEMVFDDQCCHRLAQLPPASRYLLARIDSDDLYHPVTASTLLKQRPTTPFLQFNRGFALDVRTGDVLPWRSRSSPFYTHVYGEEVRRLEVWEEPNHTTVAQSATTLGAGHFLVSLHRSNTSTTRKHAAGGALPAERSRSIAGQFGIGGERRMDELAGTTRLPVRWRPRWRELQLELAPLVNEMNARMGEVAVSVTAVALLQLACEMTAARRVAVIDDVFAAVAVRSRNVATCDLFVSTPASVPAVRHALPPTLAAYAASSTQDAEPHAYDVAYVNLRCARPDPKVLRSALDAIVVTGLLIIAGVDAVRWGSVLGAALEGLVVDRYPEMEVLATDASGTTCWLLGRPLRS
jgi:hypothetical protein